MKARLIGEGSSPLVCAPLVGATEEALLAELSVVLPKRPDAIEWRADFFAGLGDTAAVVGMGRRIKEEAGERCVIFTIRSVREGGQPIPLSAREVVELGAAICAGTDIEYVDCELGNRPEDIEYLRDAAHRHGARVIASFHDFGATPEREVLMGKFLAAERYGLDVAKVAVMPKSLEDVLLLLEVTLEAKRTVKVPLITMSMGGCGAISRIVGGVFGSSLSFAVGQNASAPGQIPIEDLRTALQIVERSKGAEIQPSRGRRKSEDHT